MMVGEPCNRAVVFGRESVRVAASECRGMQVGDLVVGPLAAGDDLDAQTHVKLVIREQKTEMEHPHVL